MEKNITDRQWVRDEDGYEVMLTREQIRELIKRKEEKNKKGRKENIYIQKEEIEKNEAMEKEVKKEIKKEKIGGKKEKLYKEIYNGAREQRMSIDKKEKLVKKLAVLARKDLIKAPKGFLIWKKCPECGSEISQEKWSDGGYPDYGDAYEYYNCLSCGYEYGMTSIAKRIKEEFFDWV